MFRFNSCTFLHAMKDQTSSVSDKYHKEENKTKFQNSMQYTLAKLVHQTLSEVPSNMKPLCKISSKLISHTSYSNHYAIWTSSCLKKKKKLQVQKCAKIWKSFFINYTITLFWNRNKNRPEKWNLKQEPNETLKRNWLWKTSHD